MGNKIEAGVVSRSELTVVSKLFNTHHVWNGDTSRPEAALRKTLAALQLEKLDVVEAGGQAEPLHHLDAGRPDRVVILDDGRQRG